MNTTRIDPHAEILKKYGATNIESYCLVNNYGYTFEIDGKRYDARYWANCYGCALNRWEVDSLTKRADNPNFYEPMDKNLKKKIEDDLNAYGE